MLFRGGATGETIHDGDTQTDLRNRECHYAVQVQFVEPAQGREKIRSSLAQVPRRREHLDSGIASVISQRFQTENAYFLSEPDRQFMLHSGKYFQPRSCRIMTLQLAGSLRALRQRFESLHLTQDFLE